jgi:hypothetical protein
MQKRGKKLPDEDTINARLRELTAKTRKLAAELRADSYQSKDRTRSLARVLPSLAAPRRRMR